MQYLRQLLRGVLPQRRPFNEVPQTVHAEPLSEGTFAMRKRWVVLAVAAIGVLGASIAYASIPDQSGVIHGCRNNGSGVLRVIDSGQTCSPAESSLDWVQSAGFEVFRSDGVSPPVEITAVAPDPFQHVMTLPLSPGSYEINNFVEVQKDSGDGLVVCVTVVAPGFASFVGRTAMGTAPGDLRWVTMSGAGLFGFATGGQAELLCRQRSGATGAHPFVVEADISAVRIGTVSQHEDGF
jgi:hypothetical protein